MNAVYFAIGCILAVLIIYWGSAGTEPAWLAGFFGQRAQRKLDTQHADASVSKKRKR
jgi:hypothetical protein